MIKSKIDMKLQRQQSGSKRINGFNVKKGNKSKIHEDMRRRQRKWLDKNTERKIKSRKINNVRLIMQNQLKEYVNNSKDQRLQNKKSYIDKKKY